MEADAHRAAIRFIRAMDRDVDEGSFGGEDAWAFMEDLNNEYATTGRGLNEMQLAAVRDFGIAIGMRPGTPMSGYQPALQRALGPRTIADAVFAVFVQWMHGQVNGGGSSVQKVRTNTVSMDSEFGTTAGWHKKTDLK